MSFNCTELNNQFKTIFPTSAEKITPYNQNDTHLALSNATFLVMNYLMTTQAANITVLGKILSAGRFIVASLRSVTSYNAIPQSASIEKLIADPSMHLAGQLHPAIHKVHSVGRVAGVTRGCFSKMGAYLKSSGRSVKDFFKGAVIHTFNLGCEAFNTYQAFVSPSFSSHKRP